MILQYKLAKGNHCWIAHNDNGGVQFWAMKAEATSYDGPRIFGGLERHYATPPEYMRDDPPSRKECWLLGGPCWHDGSSWYAEDHWIPLWQLDPDNFAVIFEALKREHVKVFGRTDDE